MFIILANFDLCYSCLLFLFSYSAMAPKQGENKKGTKRKRTKFIEHIVETDPSLKFIPMPTQNEHGSSTVQTPPTYCAPFPTYPLPPSPAQTHTSYPTQNPSFPTLTQPLFHSPTPPTYITTPTVHSHSPNYRSQVATHYFSCPFPLPKLSFTCPYTIYIIPDKHSTIILFIYSTHIHHFSIPYTHYFSIPFTLPKFPTTSTYS